MCSTALVQKDTKQTLTVPADNCKSKRKDKKREQVAVVVDVDRCRGNQIRYQLCWSCERLFAVSNLLPEADGRYL